MSWCFFRQAKNEEKRRRAGETPALRKATGEGAAGFENRSAGLVRWRPTLARTARMGTPQKQRQERGSLCASRRKIFVSLDTAQFVRDGMTTKKPAWAGAGAPALISQESWD